MRSILAKKIHILLLKRCDKCYYVTRKELFYVIATRLGRLTFEERVCILNELLENKVITGYDRYGVFLNQPQ